MSTILIPLGLAFIMLTVGLGLRAGDFGRVARHPQAVAAGLAGQLVLLPLAAICTALLFGLPPLPALGLVLIACVPGGVTSNFITVLARGDVALSVALTALSTMLAALTVPLALRVALGVLDPGGVALPERLPLAATAQAVLLLGTLPMAAGMALRALAPSLAARLLAPARRAATVLFAAIVVAAFAGDWQVVENSWRRVGPAVLTFNALAVALGLGLGRLSGLAPQATITLAIECGLQNVALALFLGGGVLGEPALMVPAAIYALVMNASALVLVAAGRRRDVQVASLSTPRR